MESWNHEGGKGLFVGPPCKFLEQGKGKVENPPINSFSSSFRSIWSSCQSGCLICLHDSNPGYLDA